MRVLKTDSWLDSKSLRFGSKKIDSGFSPLVFMPWSPLDILPLCIHRQFGAIVLSRHFIENPVSRDEEVSHSLFRDHFYCIGACRKDQDHYLLLGMSHLFEPTHKLVFYPDRYRRAAFESVFPEHMVRVSFSQTPNAEIVPHSFELRPCSPTHRTSEEERDYAIGTGGRMDTDSVRPTVAYNGASDRDSAYYKYLINEIACAFRGVVTHISIETDFRYRTLHIGAFFNMPFCSHESRFTCGSEISYEALEDGGFDSICRSVVEGMASNFMGSFVKDVLHSFIKTHQPRDLITFRESDMEIPFVASGTERLVTTRSARVLKL